MKKAHLIIALLAIALLGIYHQRGNIALRLIPPAMESIMSSNKIEQLGDGLHIALCGAGGPMPSATRSSACVAVVAAGKLFLVDAGSNGIRNLSRMGYAPGAISAVFLSHFHSDHIDGLGEVATIRWAAGNHRSPLPVYGPKGVSQVVDGFNTAYQQDALYRNEHHGDTVAPLSGKGMSAMSFALPQIGHAAKVYEQDGLKIEMIAVEHFPVTPSVAYLFSYKGRTALISGDTVKSANIEKFSNGIDLLVHEALAANLVNAMHQGATAVGHLPRAKIFSDILDYHATPKQVAEIARDAGVGHLLYYHIVPPLVVPGSKAAWLQGVDEIFSDYSLGEDGTSFSLPANSAAIIQTASSL